MFLQTLLRTQRQRLLLGPVSRLYSTSSVVLPLSLAGLDSRWIRLPESEKGAIADQIAVLEKGDWKKMTLEQKRAGEALLLFFWLVPSSKTAEWTTYLFGDLKKQPTILPMAHMMPVPLPILLSSILWLAGSSSFSAFHLDSGAGSRPVSACYSVAWVQRRKRATLQLGLPFSSRMPCGFP
jgi:hypothetical protein